MFLDLALSREKDIWQQRALPLCRVKHHEIKKLQDETWQIHISGKKTIINNVVIKQWKSMLR